MSARDVDAHRSVSHTGSSVQNSRTSSRDTLQRYVRQEMAMISKFAHEVCILFCNP